jgi:hypothetical protein
MGQRVHPLPRYQVLGVGDRHSRSVFESVTHGPENRIVREALAVAFTLCKAQNRD